LKRPNYFSGKLLTAEDLQDEQNYQRKKQRLHNRYLHGWGVASGLEVSVKGASIYIAPGLALDCYGNEIVVSTVTVLDLPDLEQSKKTLFVGISYQERFTDPMPVLDSESIEYGYIEESYESLIQNQNSNRGHRHSGGRWCACGAAHPITIARLIKGQKAWRVDRRYNPPRIK
jgi:hypothetical protein